MIVFSLVIANIYIYSDCIFDDIINDCITIISILFAYFNMEEAIDRNVPVNNSLLTGTFRSINPY